MVNVERVVDRASRARDPANAPDRAQDPDSDSDDDSIDVETYMNGLSIGERVRLTHRVTDRTEMSKIQRLCEKMGRMLISNMNRAHDPARVVLSFGETLMLVVMADWTNMHGRNVPQVALKAVWDAVKDHSVLLAMLVENEEGTIRFFMQRTGDALIATKRNIMEIIASGQHPGGRDFPGYPADNGAANAGGDNNGNGEGDGDGILHLLGQQCGHAPQA